ncbi:MAG: hypothetical protein QG629_809 [Patescibacteria group bacterium]|nr:hypothetical protein [Patescibacteria group bacterium]
MNVDVNLLAVFVAAVAQFVVGAIWYTPIFGKVWGEIHGFDKLSAKTQKEMQKSMGPWLALQFVMGFITAFVLAHVIGAFPNENVYKLAAWMWLGFIVPTQVAAVIFGGTEGKWIGKKIYIMAGGSLACLLTAALVIGLF